MLKIDNESFDPYFILGVSEDDNVEHINKIFRRKAKLLHPDKMNEIDKKNKHKVIQRNKHFKILIDCYEYIMQKNTPFLGNVSHTNDLTTQIYGDSDFVLNDFNKKFEKIRLTEHINEKEIGKDQEPIGYNVNRMSNINEYKNCPEQHKIFTQFNHTDFNKAFEYTKDNIEETPFDLAAENSALIIVGNGNTNNAYADFSTLLNAPKNPTSIPIIPRTFKLKKDESIFKSKDEMSGELERRNKTYLEMEKINKSYTYN